MAITTVNLIAGAGTLSLAPYLSGGADNSPTDLGSTDGGVILQLKSSYVQVKSDQHLPIVAMFKSGEEYTIKTMLQESTLANLAILWDHPTTAVSGGTFYVGDNLVSNYRQLKFVSGAGKGPNGLTRTIYAWRAVSFSSGAQAYKKDKEWFSEVNFICLWDSSVSGNDKVLKITDA